MHEGIGTLLDESLRQVSAARLRSVCSSGTATARHAHFSLASSTQHPAPAPLQSASFCGRARGGRLDLLPLTRPSSARQFAQTLSSEEEKLLNKLRFSCLIVVNELLQQSLAGKPYQCQQRAGTAAAKPP